MVRPGWIRRTAGVRRCTVRFGVVLGVVLVTGLALGACASSASSGSHPPSTQPPATSAPTTSTSAPTAPSGTDGTPTVACATDELAGSSPGGGADPERVATTVLLRNTSSTTCVLAGYPSLQLVDAHGRELRTRTVDGGSFPFTDLPVTMVTLDPGGVASFHIGSSPVRAPAPTARTRPSSG